MKMLPQRISQSTPKNSIGYIVGQILAVILIGCLAAVLICLAVRLCGWILTV